MFEKFLQKLNTHEISVSYAVLKGINYNMGLIYFF